mmetsp:Transcript_65900/g.190117  ORF Transcript_65900/g.190117 Transcript_65900/m.190117 type:complete len:142 (+) Transcript_65900:75-500(+)|eukprot:CAMPEP_0176095320 /NCGR_PEP_ID=MMETSP0120_2-20121206/47775_1 /TAXON_ID=160619 /ORGANISM="Kryptoperidinium foliaceum, Strain CCMP 1326" /LENGTH=141 /DNA_ID=CAMNT_0017429283 /DNA_START=47 /DNA_END=469 /DNA_ORIENTATION=-
MASANQEQLTPQQVQAAFQQIEKECSALLNKIAELEQEVNEHSLVLKAFEKVEPTRRCFRMVGGVLVERTVAEIAPVVRQNQDKIKAVVKKIEESLKTKTQQRTAFMNKYGLNRQGGGGAGGVGAAAGGEQAKAGGGSVLV